jgi:hypothetical protein
MAQTSYARSFDVAFEGMKVDTTDDTVVTKRNAEASTAIPVGRFVKRGTGDDDALLLSAAGDNDDVEGITIHSHAMDSDATTTTSYAVKAPMSVVRKGRAWMKTEQAVGPTDPVFARYANGASVITNRGTVRKDADTNGAFRVPGAKFLTTATANTLVQVEFEKMANDAAIYAALLP